MKSKNTNKYRIVKFIIDNPGKTAKVINKMVLNKTNNGYYSSVYASLRKDGIVDNNGKGYFITDYGLSIVATLPGCDAFVETMEETLRNKDIRELSKEELVILKKISVFTPTKTELKDLNIDSKVVSKLIKLDLISFGGTMYVIPFRSKQKVFDLI